MLFTVFNSKGILDQVCGEVKDINEEVKPYLQEAVIEMQENRGVAIAAPQIGVLYSWYLDYKGIVYINPLIISRSDLQRKPEQCLSVPGFTAFQDRYENITLQFTDLFGDLKIQNLTGLDAQIAQHEINHLMGKTINDQAKS